MGRSKSDYCRSDRTSAATWSTWTILPGLPIHRTMTGPGKALIWTISQKLWKSHYEQRVAYAELLDSLLFSPDVVIVDRSRSKNKVINVGIIANATTVGHGDAGQFIAASTSGAPNNGTMITTSGTIIASNPRRAISAENG